MASLPGWAPASHCTVIQPRKRTSMIKTLAPSIPSWFFALLLMVGVLPAQAFEPFPVEEIKVDGLQRISAGTVFTYLPVRIGETFTPEKSRESLQALFKTGYFNDIGLVRDGNTLVVEVVERPAISEIAFNGNKAIDEEELTKALKSIGFAEGRVYDKSLLDKVEQELERQYFSQGKYAVEIVSTVTPRPRNRVDIQIDITEGKAARIRRISLVGNQAFRDKKLLDEFELSPSGWWSSLFSNDQYSREKLAADLEALRSFYLNRGYINFRVDSTQVAISPNKQDIFVTVNLTEGQQYTVAGVKIAGNPVVSEEEIRSKITLESGKIFSQQKIAESIEGITERIGDEGYAFANVNPTPEFHAEEQAVTVTFYIDPGRRVYVRRINFSGNARTRDEVLRREMRQMEGGWASTQKIKRSRTRLERLGFFEDVQVETVKLPEAPDQVDVNFTVVERPSGNLLAGLGYSQNQGLMFNASVTQDNFLGSGKKVSVAFNNSRVNTVYSFSYSDPYYTIDGMSQAFGLYYRETDAYEANLSRYTMDAVGGTLSFGIPLSEYNHIRFGLKGEQTQLKTTTQSAQEVFDYIYENGDRYNILQLTGSWSHDTRNRALFPDRGMLQSLSAEVSVPVGDLQFYKLNYRHRWYRPLTHGLTLSLRGDIGYGKGYNGNAFPFFENYTAGGPYTVRGFEENSLGPRDSRDNPLGGSFQVVANAEVFFPVPFTKQSKSFRLSTFVDGGNVFAEQADFDAGELRYAGGVAATWYSPLGGLRFSLAKPLNSKDGDDVQIFQFSLGTTFF